MRTDQRMRRAAGASCRAIAIVFALVGMNVSLPSFLRAQTAPSASPNAAMVSAPHVSRADSTDGDLSGWRFDQCLGGLTYGAPLKLAVSWAGGMRKELDSGQDVCAFVSPKIGLGGARISAGFARTFGTFGSGLAVSGGILRTFGAPSYADRMSTYAGGSLHVFPILGIGLELGTYHRLGGVDGQGRKSIIIWSAGFGF
ncbi:MAG: hypothetical protein ABI852_00545 [Gemmatimonadaceae bacterium]